VVASDANQDPAELKEETLQRIGSGKRILIIDDDLSSQNYIASTLNSWGFEVHSALNGTEGLVLAKRLKPDVITLDVMMPGIDGWSVLTDLKANPDLAHIPVIMTTFINDQNLGYALGAADYIVKPIDRQQLLKTLQRLNIKAGGSILIVEDDPMNRDVLGRQLLKEGYRVEEATNGIQALELLKVIQPKLILLDLMMPQMDGFQVIDRLKETPEWRSIPIVVLTAKDLDAYDRQRLQGFVESIYRKGNYDRQQFMTEVHRLLTNIVST
jgi:CheY-like chemotaxis protein